MIKIIVFLAILIINFCIIIDSILTYQSSAKTFIPLHQSLRNSSGNDLSQLEVINQDTPEEDTVARVIRTGKGYVDVGGPSTNKGKTKFSPETPDQRLPHRLKYTTSNTADQSVISSWEPLQFTDPRALNEHSKMNKFRFIVHGLELTHLVPGLNEFGSFDNFVKNYLNPTIQTGDHFIKYYPYYLFKKVLIAGSVISQNLTATFCEVGFIFEVPPYNFLCCGKHDLKTPIDRQFYGKEADIPDITSFIQKYPMHTLDTFLPLEKKVIQSEYQEIFHDETQEPCKLSWYNEVVFVPQSSRGNSKIIGVFFRTNDINTFLSKNHAKLMWDLAENFDLPIIQIVDGKEYLAL